MSSHPAAHHRLDSAVLEGGGEVWLGAIDPRGLPGYVRREGDPVEPKGWILYVRRLIPPGEADDVLGEASPPDEQAYVANLYVEELEPECGFVPGFVQGSLAAREGRIVIGYACTDYFADAPSKDGYARWSRVIALDGRDVAWRWDAPAGSPSSAGGTSGSGGATGPGGSGNGAQQGTPDPGAMGAPCIPGVEQQPDFSGFTVEEVNVEIGSPACGGGVCLTHHFQGRVSCPYGQTEDALSLDPADGRRCRVPGETGAAVEVPVPPQLVERRAENVVHCSCQCAGSDPAVEYCQCPEGMECVELGLSSHCIKTGTPYEPGTSTLGPSCSMDSSSAETDCGHDRKNP